MYSWEIDCTLRDYNYQIPSTVYLEISDTKKNSQVCNVEYNSWSDTFTMWTNDGYNWSFKVYRDGDN